MQVVEAVADPIWPADLPAAWLDARGTLGTYRRELPDAWATVFQNSLGGRQRSGMAAHLGSGGGHVMPTRWDSASQFLQRAHVLFVSREDAAGNDDYSGLFGPPGPLDGGDRRLARSTVVRARLSCQVPPRPAREVDPTGAGDVFASAFLIRLAETGDPVQAARFANVVASFSVEGLGMEPSPQRAQVEAWLAGQDSSE